MNEHDNRTVTTVEELDALPVGSVLLEGNGDVSRVTVTSSGTPGIEQTGEKGRWSMSWVKLPATVLFVPPTTESSDDNA